MGYLYDFLTHISKFGTKCNDKHMPVFFLLIYMHSLLAYKQYLFFHTLDTILVIEFSHSKPSPTLCS